VTQLEGIFCGLLVGCAVVLRWPGSIGRVGRLRRLVTTFSSTQHAVARGPSRWFRTVRTARSLASFGRSAARRHTDAHRTAAAAVEFTSAVAGHLRIGAAAETAIERSAGEVTEPRLKTAMTPAVRAIGLGADPVRTLQQLAVVPGCHVLAWCAAAWRVAESSGGSLATTIESIAATGRAEELQRQSVAAALAAPRATARLLAMLPFAGLALGTALGADPLGTLLHTPVGILCSASGILLQYVGLRWTTALVRAAERMA